MDAAAMSKALEEDLTAGTPVVLTADDWKAVEADVEVVARHDTQLAGEIVIARISGHLIVVERSKAGERVARLMPDQAAVDAFVKDRLDTYERMWDGCGCKVDYYG